MNATTVEKWMDGVIEEDEISRYLDCGRDFVDDDEIERLLGENRDPEPQRVRDILARSLALERLDPVETAALLNVKDQDLWQEISVRSNRPLLHGHRQERKSTPFLHS